MCEVEPEKEPKSICAFLLETPTRRTRTDVGSVSGHRRSTGTHERNGATRPGSSASGRHTSVVHWTTWFNGAAGHTEYRGGPSVFFALDSADGSMASATFGGLHFEILA